jgi:hypothetical protein
VELHAPRGGARTRHQLWAPRVLVGEPDAGVLAGTGRAARRPQPRLEGSLQSRTLNTHRANAFSINCTSSAAERLSVMSISSRSRSKRGTAAGSIALPAVGHASGCRLRSSSMSIMSASADHVPNPLQSNRLFRYIFAPSGRRIRCAGRFLSRKSRTRKPLQVLSVDGGGYLGLATAAFLQSVEARLKVRSTDRFDLFCGTSTGAIIALALASGKSAMDIVQLYESMGPKVFTRPPFHERVWPALRTARSIMRSLHDNAALRNALSEVFGDLTLGELRENGKFVLITAFNLTSGTPTVFKTDHGIGLGLHDRYLVRDVALASSAAPMYLPLIELIHPSSQITERFCDGGVVSNSPALLGYAEAVSHLGQAPQNVRILSLGTPRTNLAERESMLRWGQRSLRRGLWGWGLGEKIIGLTIDGGSMVSDTALRRIAAAAGTYYVRVSLVQPEGVGLDIATPEASRTLRQLGVERGRDATLMNQIAPFFDTEML